MGQLTVGDFRTLCADTIRVHLDWCRLESEKRSVSTTIIAEPAALSSFVFPWYVLRRGGETTWEDPSGSPLCADDLPMRLRSLTLARQNAVHEMADSLERSRPPALVVIAAYRLPNSRWLVLDGNHRLAALRVRPLPFRLLLVGLDGPLDRRIVPDLRHHGG